MSGNNTVHQPSRSNQEYVMVDGVRKRNTAYEGKKSKSSSDTSVQGGLSAALRDFALPDYTVEEKKAAFVDCTYDEAFIELDYDLDGDYTIEWGGDYYHNGRDFLEDMSVEVYDLGNDDPFASNPDSSNWRDNSIELPIPTNPTNSFVEESNEESLRKEFPAIYRVENGKAYVKLHDFFGDDPMNGIPIESRDMVTVLATARHNDSPTLSDSHYDALVDKHVDSIVRNVDHLEYTVDTLAEEDGAQWARDNGLDPQASEDDYRAYVEYCDEKRSDYLESLGLLNGRAGYRGTLVRDAIFTHLESMENDGLDPAGFTIHNSDYEEVVKTILSNEGVRW